MDHLTKYIVYNKTPEDRDTLDYDRKNQKKEAKEKGIIDKRLLLLSPDLERHSEERVLYARNKLLAGSKPAVVGGKPITEEEAVELRLTAFGTAACPPRGEWVRTPLIMRSPDQPLAYGLAAPRNGARSLLSALQAHIIKWLLFDSRPPTKDNKSALPPDTYLKPSEERQEEALWRACSEVIWRCGGGFNPQTGVEPKAIVALPSETIYVQHSSHYYQDGITEKFQTEDGSGALLLLYAVILSRGIENLKKDLDGKLTHLVSAQVEGSINVVTLLLTGRATPYLHNGVLYVGDEDHYAMPQFGSLSRSPVGLLVWYGGDDSGKHNVHKQYPGSRLKTPAFPIWVTSCSGHYGVLFNTNRELLRNYHAERRFDIHYYTCGGCNVLLNVDTRAHDDSPGCLRADDISATPLEKLIHTKWQDAKITWTGSAPYVGDTPLHLKKDLDGKLTHLVSAQVEGSINVVTLLLTGRATPYLHNGVLYVGDEDHYAMPQFGSLSRSPVGLLVWYGGDDSGKHNVHKQYPGSRLKTPAFPIWVTSCSGHYGVLFNTNRELLRNYHAERRFDIHYYTCGGCNVLLNVDTRAHDDSPGCLRADDISATPLEKLIHTKWQDAKITWTGSAPYVGDTPLQ